MSVGSKSGSRILRLHAGINIQGGSRCDGWLRHREMRGYDVCGDSRLSSKCRCSGAVLYFVVEFCPEVVTAMLFDATASALF